MCFGGRDGLFAGPFVAAGFDECAGLDERCANGGFSECDGLGERGALENFDVRDGYADFGMRGGLMAVAFGARSTM